MLPDFLLWLLLPLAAISGWFFAYIEYKKKVATVDYKLSSDYVKGINFLLNEQPDKAIDFFVKKLEVDNDSIDTHLALGSLFRQRGEVERAIRIHQNLVAMPNLNTSFREQALFDLAKDYMSAGLLDRVEDICLELVDNHIENVQALGLLREVYEREKEWFRGISVVRKLQSYTGKSQKLVLSQYYCELADQAKRIGDNGQLQRMLERAVSESSDCGRALIMQGDAAKEQGLFADALDFYKQLERVQAQYLPEIYASMIECYEVLDDRDEMFVYLKGLLDRCHGVELLLALAKQIRQDKGVKEALDFVGAYVSKRPSLRGANYLLELELEYSDQRRRHSGLVKVALDHLLEKKPIYKCMSCGFVGCSLHWQCPSCKQWVTVQPIQEFQWGASI